MNSLAVLICKIGEHLCGMATRADRFIGFDDCALFVNQITDAFCESGLGIVTRAIGEANRAIGVTK